MNVVQNYLVSIMKTDMSLYETRIFCRIVLAANSVLHDVNQSKPFKRLIGQQIKVVEEYVIKVPISEIITENSHDYKAVIDGAKKLQDRVIEYYDSENKKWSMHREHLIGAIDYKQGSGILQFTVSPWLMSYILDFLYGNFSMYDFESALKLPSSYAIRWYWLTCSSSDPVDYPLTMLRDMFGANDKYKQNNDFVKRCIETPCKILAEHHLNGFRYIKQGHGKKTIIKVIPVKRQEPNKQSLTAMAGVSAWCSPPIRNYLLTAANFENSELEKNKSTLFEFCRLPDAKDRIIKIVERARKQRANKGYIINAMKSSVKEYSQNTTL